MQTRNIFKNGYVKLGSVFVSYVFFCFLALSQYIFRFATAGYCSKGYTCASTCTRQTKYYKSCGWLGHDRCGKYRWKNFTFQLFIIIKIQIKCFNLEIMRNFNTDNMKTKLSTNIIKPWR